MRTVRLIVGIGCVVGLWSAAASAVPTPQLSLNTCQNAVKVEAAKFIKNKVTAIGSCLQAVSTQLVKNNAVDASGAAAVCVTQFRLISDSRGPGKGMPEKLKAGIEKKCMPGGTNTHTLQDILGTGAGVLQPLEAESIGAWCAHFGGGGTITSLQNWIDCVTASAECSVDAAISTQYPRALEWLDAVKPKMQQLTPPKTDTTKITDAVAGLDAVRSAIAGPGGGTTPDIQCGSNWPSTGTAGVSDVLAGKTFSNDISTGLTGTMTNNGAVTLTPGATDQAIVAGYHSGTGKVTGDPDLVPGSIRSGVNLFSVVGDSNVVNTSSGDALAGDVLLGKKTWVDGLEVTGTMPNNAAVTLTPGTTDQPIAAGYHNGLGNVVGDANLLASNIINGVSIFGVTGTLKCGDAVIDAGEDCDQANLNANTCVTQGFAGGTLQCGASCLFDASGCYAARFVDNGNTITDNQTRLMWEKKAALNNVTVKCTSAAICPNPHDADNLYTWSAGDPWTPNGTVYLVFLVQLNAGAGFAGHTDWRLPTREELQGIVDYADASGPVVDTAAFDTGCTSSCTETTCSCTGSANYWSSSATATNVQNNWIVNFSNGDVTNDTRDTDYYARAVRGL